MVRQGRHGPRRPEPPARARRRRPPTRTPAGRPRDGDRAGAPEGRPQRKLVAGEPPGPAPGPEPPARARESPGAVLVPAPRRPRRGPAGSTGGSEADRRAQADQRNPQARRMARYREGPADAIP